MDCRASLVMTERAASHCEESSTRQSMPFIPATPTRQGLVGVVRSGGADCLTESGIVWLSVAFRLWQGRPSRHATENQYEAPEGVSAHPERTAPIRPPHRSASFRKKACIPSTSQHSYHRRNDLGTDRKKSSLPHNKISQPPPAMWISPVPPPALTSFSISHDAHSSSG